MTPAQKTSTVKGWFDSRIATIRQGAKGIGHIIRFVWLKSTPEYYRAIGFPPMETSSADSKAQHDAQKAVDDRRRVLLDQAVEMEYEGEQVKMIKTGTLVIGSGPGGSAFVRSFTRQLGQVDKLKTAQYNLDVLILDKGTSFAPQPSGPPLPETEGQGLEQLFEDGSVLTSDTGGISILAGSTWGGGGRINWSACLNTDRIVREEWTRSLVGKNKLGVRDPYGRLFLGKEWQECMDA